MFCSHCGFENGESFRFCSKCGKSLAPVDPDVSEKSRLVAFLLCTFVGVFGVHRFYAGKITSGILQILFGWATLFIWLLVDWIMILAGSFRDSNGKVIKNWNAD
jgi:TM2 domain-containing membrane protein YozV